MKKNIWILSVLFVSILSITGLTTNKRPVVPGDLTIYTGRYQHKFGGASPYVDVLYENGKLFGINSWDSARRDLEYLNRDNFIVKGFGWAVRFIRNRNQKVNIVNISGYGDWVRINKDSSIAASTKWKQGIEYSKSHPFNINSNTLKSFSGSYQKQQILLQNGSLYFITVSNYKARLSPVNDNTFTFDSCKMQFYHDRDGNVNELAILFENGFVELYRKDK